MGGVAQKPCARLQLHSGHKGHCTAGTWGAAQQAHDRLMATARRLSRRAARADARGEQPSKTGLDQPHTCSCGAPARPSALHTLPPPPCCPRPAPARLSAPAGIGARAAKDPMCTAAKGPNVHRSKGPNVHRSKRTQCAPQWGSGLVPIPARNTVLALARLAAANQRHVSALHTTHMRRAPRPSRMQGMDHAHPGTHSLSLLSAGACVRRRHSEVLSSHVCFVAAL